MIPTNDLVYAYRITRLPLLDAGGVAIGKIDDVVIVAGRGSEAPRVLGFVSSSQRRRIFISAARVAAVDNSGVRLKSFDIDLKPFLVREGERLIASDLLDKKVGDETVVDVALQHQGGHHPGWNVTHVRLAKRGALLTRPSFRLVPWTECATLFAPSTPVAAEAARLRGMHPSDVAAVIVALPIEQRRTIAAAMEDERLADVLEELPEEEQLRLIEGLDLERLNNVFDEMEYDDLADLLGKMGNEQRARVLESMDEDDADTMRQLLSWPDGTAGALMTPELIVLSPEATVAEALAHVRDPERHPSVAGQVFVTHGPHEPPTGGYLGVVHFQRLLREPPQTKLKDCVQHEPTIPPTMSEREVIIRIATYNLLSVAVVDAANHLLGAITVDDVLDRALPANWRMNERSHHPSAGTNANGGQP
ncbi:MAG: magnesium transporter MgtE N-terminal domain-containing protein [Ilumatobacteraceae bacterium]|nr:magnesium transporter [Actinomycetota bacterium]NCV97031.1 magnesium transporter [Acidimicrobiia bacterium]NCV47493.1 magnesium transporter [Actinomycetota bacterium]NCX18055.1 magnesium transporter [Acidimicrobiia bacterium]NCX31235.1 magnesium transporter [Actinomycetota bacterium]